MRRRLLVVSRTQRFGHNGLCRTYEGFDFVLSIDGRKWKKMQRKAREIRRARARAESRSPR